MVFYFVFSYGNVIGFIIFFQIKYYLSPSIVHKADKNKAALSKMRVKGWVALAY